MMVNMKMMLMVAIIGVSLPAMESIDPCRLLAHVHCCSDFSFTHTRSTTTISLLLLQFCFYWDVHNIAMV